MSTKNDIKKCEVSSETTDTHLEKIATRIFAANDESDSDSEEILAALTDRRDALIAAATTRTIEIMDEGSASSEIEVPAGATDAEIDELVEDAWRASGEWGEPKSILSVGWRFSTDDGANCQWHSLEIEVGNNSDPPDCCGGSEDHDWRSPEWLGGCSENPGVWEVGGRIRQTSVCAKCGAYQHWTGPTRADAYRQEPEQIEYSDPSERSLEWVESLQERD